MLTLYSSSNKKKLDLSPSHSDTLTREIMGDAVLSLSFTHWEHIPIEVGDYVVWEGERFTVLWRQYPLQISTQEWRYQLQLLGESARLKRYHIVSPDGDPIFTLTSPAAEHLRLIVAAMNECEGGQEWKVGRVVATDNLVIDYNCTTLDAALQLVAEAAHTEWWLEGKTLHLTRCEWGEALPLAYGEGLITLEQSKADGHKTYTRIYPIGSSRNIDPSTYGAARLLLPNGAKFLDLPANKELGRIDHHERDAFSHIYPRRIGTITAVRSEQRTLEGKRAEVYFVKDNGLDFDPAAQLMAGKVMQFSFQEGSDLAGREFECNWHAATREFELITKWLGDGTTTLPNASLPPKVGDRYLLWNMKMPDSYLRAAEQELLQAVQAYNERHHLDLAVYKARTDFEHLERNAITLRLGQRVSLKSKEFFASGTRASRISKIVQHLDCPSMMDIEMADTLSKGVLQRIQGEMGRVEQQVRRVEATQPQVLHVGDAEPATDDNIYSAARTHREFLSKTQADTALAHITFNNGLTARQPATLEQGASFGAFAPSLMGGSGARIDARGNAEVESIKVRSRMEVAELVVNRQTTLESDYLLTEGDTVESVKAEENGEYTLSLRREWEGYRTSLTAGAVLRGIYNNLADGGSTYETTWAKVLAIDTERNGLRIALYNNNECPAGANHPPRPLLRLSRWGHTTDEARQSTYLLSSRDQRIALLTHVTKPIVTADNISSWQGRLDGLTWRDAAGTQHQLQGYGNVMGNAYITGSLHVGGELTGGIADKVKEIEGKVGTGSHVHIRYSNDGRTFTAGDSLHRNLIANPVDIDTTGTLRVPYQLDPDALRLINQYKVVTMSCEASMEGDGFMGVEWVFERTRNGRRETVWGGFNSARTGALGGVTAELKPFKKTYRLSENEEWHAITNTKLWATTEKAPCRFRISKPRIEIGEEVHNDDYSFGTTIGKFVGISVSPGEFPSKNFADYIWFEVGDVRAMEAIKQVADQAKTQLERITSDAFRDGIVTAAEAAAIARAKAEQLESERGYLLARADAVLSAHPQLQATHPEEYARISTTQRNERARFVDASRDLVQLLRAFVRGDLQYRVEGSVVQLGVPYEDLWTQRVGDRSLSAWYEQHRNAFETAIVAADRGKDGAKGETGAPGQKGKDAHSPYIGNAGTWMVWDDNRGDYVDSHDPARGENGANGLAPRINASGYWEVYEDGAWHATTIKARGENGKNGTNGRSLTTATALYRLHESKTTAPPPPSSKTSLNGWLRAKPFYEAGRYLWRCEMQEYSSAPTLLFTPAMLESEWEALQQMQVGGANFFGFGKGIEAQDFNNPPTATGTARTFSVRCSYEGRPLPRVGSGGRLYGFRLECTQAFSGQGTSTYAAYRQHAILVRLAQLGLPARGWYAVSFRVRANRNFPSTSRGGLFHVNLCDVGTTRFTPSTQWQEVRFIADAQNYLADADPYTHRGFLDIEADSDAVGSNPRGEHFLKVGDWLEIDQLMIERGNVHSPFRPSLDYLTQLLSEPSGINDGVVFAGRMDVRQGGQTTALLNGVNLATTPVLAAGGIVEQQGQPIGANVEIWADGRMKLGDKLQWDGQTLSLNGEVKAKSFDYLVSPPPRITNGNKPQGSIIMGGGSYTLPALEEGEVRSFRGVLQSTLMPKGDYQMQRFAPKGENASVRIYVNKNVNADPTEPTLRVWEALGYRVPEGLTVWLVYAVSEINIDSYSSEYSKNMPPKGQPRIPNTPYI